MTILYRTARFSDISGPGGWQKRSCRWWNIQARPPEKQRRRAGLKAAFPRVRRINPAPVAAANMRG
jgi:hypothetical protein